MAKYVKVSATRLTSLYRVIKEGVTRQGGVVDTRTAGKEIVWDIRPPNRQALVRVFTSLGIGGTAARPVGKDTIRIVVGALLPDGKFRPVTGAKRVFRTAPEKPTEPERVEYFMERFKGEIRNAYAEAKEIVACPKCSYPMTKRKTKADGREFLGCLRYPECKGTRNLK